MKTENEVQVYDMAGIFYSQPVVYITSHTLLKHIHTLSLFPHIYIQLGLENMFYDDVKEGLRKLRRKLPVSKQRMDWGQVAMGKNKINKTIAK